MTETSTINPQQREREVIAVLLKHDWEYLHQNLPRSLPEDFTDFNQVAVAAGSIAQVHHAKLKNGQPVAVNAERCAQATIELAIPLAPSQPINKRQIQTDYENLLKKFYGLSLVELDLGSALQDILQIARTFIK